MRPDGNVECERLWRAISTIFATNNCVFLNKTLHYVDYLIVSTPFFLNRSMCLRKSQGKCLF